MQPLIDWMFSDAGLPVVFLMLMGISMLIYALLDGYDLGVGILMVGRREEDRDTMIASIGPFWDANETWLVLGVGLMLVAFPVAHGMILTALYLPVSLMLLGLILRGVAFDFRAKARAQHKNLWDGLFSLGSLMSALTQGYMLGQYLVGFATDPGALIFSVISAVCVTTSYALIGACWVILKTDGELQRHAKERAHYLTPLLGMGLIAVSLVNPLVSDMVAQRWFDANRIVWLAPLPLATTFLLVYLYMITGTNTNNEHKRKASDGLPLFVTMGVFILSFTGLAYSFYPYIVPGELTVWDAASAPESLRIILWGTLVVLPIILLYTALSYWIFRGKAQSLSYG